MRTITYSEARNELASTLDRVNEDCEPVLIARPKRGNAVLVSEEMWNSLEETAYLLRSPKNARRLMESIEALERGEGIPKTFDDLEDKD